PSASRMRGCAEPSLPASYVLQDYLCSSRSFTCLFSRGDRGDREKCVFLLLRVLRDLRVKSDLVITSPAPRGGTRTESETSPHRPLAESRAARRSIAVSARRPRCGRTPALPVVRSLRRRRSVPRNSRCH